MNWLVFTKKMADQAYFLMEERIFSLQKEFAENRYKDLVNNYPELLQKIPLKYLSSYLRITQRHLSRIRSKVTF
ncbi:cyclic nucleotide-binding domain-containing protein [Flammeovirga kamogawensis]|uniref:Crp/Fnr family transcriptional regulator n=1 Tax=Flammeovirga kamogawensis TaxID=373891 RepID=A0ABX8H0T3_9BACT|nr:hypothetical protein [Flammeovirga kamogawensis]MBB6459444.1 hypothetical protein [Flammeovirga kamogawensis]QWG08997.1 hypothetical protein KM029_08655 [Flammeovirga kamogawensis]